MPKILFRTAGGKAKGLQLGFGHINRCINLAKEFNDSNVFFLLEDFGGAEHFIREHGFKNIIKLKRNISFYDDVIETTKQISKNKINVLVVDKYKIKNSFLNKIRQIIKTVVISDLKKIDYPANLVINGFIGFKNSIRINKLGIRCMLGPEYQILNKQFRKKQIIKKKKFDLLVTFGGFDEKNIIKIFLKQVLQSRNHLKIKLILGPATAYSSEIKNLEQQMKNHITILQSVSDMHKEMNSSRYGLCSGGITSYEFACMKIPFAILSQVAHQTITAREWERLFIAKNLGIKNKFTDKKIKIYLNHIESNGFFFKPKYKKN